MLSLVADAWPYAGGLEIDTGETLLEMAGVPEIGDPRAICGQPTPGSSPVPATPGPNASTVVGALAAVPVATCSSPPFALSVDPLIREPGTYRVLDCRAFKIGNATANIWMFDLGGQTGVALVGLTRVTWLGVPPTSTGFAGISGARACWRTAGGQPASIDVLTGALTINPEQDCP